MMKNRICEYHVSGTNTDGSDIRARLAHFSRYHAVLEIYDLSTVLRVSQTIADFKISMEAAPIYSGRGVVGSIINTGDCLVCDIKLAEDGFKITTGAPVENIGVTSPDFGTFLNQWQKVYRVNPDFKVAIADMQMFLLDLRLWLGQLELEGFHGPKTGSNGTAANDFRGLCENVVLAFNPLHERFEEISRRIEPELRPVHESFTKRQLHPLTLSSPFAHRTFHKPLGYAGDYEMVNMMLREPLEGNSLYAKAINGWFLDQWPARAHRNRVAYLTEKLRDEALRGRRQGKNIRVLNLGCGPAQEVLQFLATEDLCEQVEVTLLDFNDETVEQTGRSLEDCRKRFRRGTKIKVLKKSVHQILKEGLKTASPEPRPQFDYIYCAGLFDYLTDRTCKQIVNIFYEWLGSEGLLVVTNVADYKPFRFMLEFLLDWNLIYRDTQKGSALIPDRANPDDCRILRDSTGVNMMVEIRKPAHA